MIMPIGQFPAKKINRHFDTTTSIISMNLTIIPPPRKKPKIQIKITFLTWLFRLDGIKRVRTKNQTKRLPMNRRQRAYSCQLWVKAETTPVAMLPRNINTKIFFRPKRSESWPKTNGLMVVPIICRLVIWLTWNSCIKIKNINLNPSKWRTSPVTFDIFLKNSGCFRRLTDSWIRSRRREGYTVTTERFHSTAIE